MKGAGRPRTGRLREVLREAWRNTASGTSHVARWAVVFAAGVGTCAALDAQTVATLADQASDYRSAGAATWVLAADGAISGPACEALGQIDGVTAAGAMRVLPDKLTITVLPGAPVPAYEVTPGFAAYFGLPVGSGVGISDQVAANTGLVAGAALHTTAGSGVVSGVYQYPEDGRRSGLGYSALLPVAATGAFDECWVEVWPVTDRIPPLIRLALLPGVAGQENQDITLGQLNRTKGESVDWAGRFDTRLTRSAPVVAVVFGLGLGFAALRSRRLELASNLHDGVPKWWVALQAWFETLVWTVCGALALALALLWVVRDAAGGWAERAAPGLAATLAGVGGAWLGAVAAALLVREKHLFAYFKNR
ncbi:MAG: hypothetical protein LBR19_03705 [Bifidobacteriaceae bacterium]|jgi:hypothetical protein|nr:hypothetical protein [Bifidobacteriaceae bacterium]